MGAIQHLVIRQEAKYDGDDWWSFSRAGGFLGADRQNTGSDSDSWWEWSVWVDGPEDELNQVQYVEYTLHPTFPNPVRKLTNRDEKFKLSTSGWGTFRIYAKVVAMDGSTLSLQHDLVLLFPDGT